MVLSDDIRARRLTWQTMQQSLIGVSASVSALTAGNNAGGSGKNYTVPFTQLPQGSFAAAPFDLTFLSGANSGGGLYINSNGAAMATVYGQYIDQFALYNDHNGNTTTNTDNQTLTTVLNSPMGPGALNYGILRSDTLGQNYVWAVGEQSGFTSYIGQIGCYVAGTSTTFAVANLNYNTQIKFRAGVSGNPYRFQLWAGSVLVIDYIDTAHTSLFGSSYRRWGFRSCSSTDGAQAPAPAALVSCIDDST
jgi:hypothetical protein